MGETMRERMMTVLAKTVHREGLRWDKMADAVLAEMREPTEAMSSAGWRAIIDSGGPDEAFADYAGWACWQAMIDAATKAGASE